MTSGSLALSPDGTTLWAGSGWGSGPSTPGPVIDCAWESAAPVHPSSLALSPDGRTLYSGGWSWDGEASHSVVALDAATGAVRAWGPTGGGGAIAVSPDGGTVYAGVSGYALALDAATLTERWRTPGNWETTDIALTPDGAKLFMTDSARLGGPAVMQYDTATGERTPFTRPRDRCGFDRDLTRWRDRVPGPRDRRRAGRNRARWRSRPATARCSAGHRGSRTGTPSTRSQSPATADPSSSRARRRSARAASRPRCSTRPAGSRRGSSRTSLRGRSDRSTSTATEPSTTPGSDRPPAISAVAADGTLRWRLAFGGGAGGVTLTPDEQTLYVTGSFTSLGGEPRRAWPPCAPPTARCCRGR